MHVSAIYMTPGQIKNQAASWMPSVRIPVFAELINPQNESLKQAIF
jgi:hypothetical protein